MPGTEKSRSSSRALFIRARGREKQYLPCGRRPASPSPSPPPGPSGSAPVAGSSSSGVGRSFRQDSCRAVSHSPIGRSVEDSQGRAGYQGRPGGIRGLTVGPSGYRYIPQPIGGVGSISWRIGPSPSEVCAGLPSGVVVYPNPGNYVETRRVGVTGVPGEFLPIAQFNSGRTGTETHIQHGQSRLLSHR